ncbi:MAG: long-chain N-acyl amino acid synthase [Herminiimonas sp.]|nr:long-chain N-acyl amino acid synthase [Herminiimonas sp.]
MIGENTIISFESPYELRDLCIVEGTADKLVENPSDEQKFNVRMVNSQGRREAASVLIKKMYSWRGYTLEQPLEGTAPNRMTLVSDTAGHTVGTMTLCFDTEVGLPADENFKDRLDQLRAVGCQLCEPSRLAIDTHVPKRVFASMIHISYIYAHNIHGYTDYIIEVNPRHAMFYKKMLGFHDFGEQRLCTRVNAPAVLLRLELSHMKRQIEKFGGMMENHGREKSFYPYFFPGVDEPGITDRLIKGRN